MQMRHPTRTKPEGAGRRLVILPPSLVRPTLPIATSRARRDGVAMRLKEGDQEQHPTTTDRPTGEHMTGKVSVMFQLKRRCNPGEAWAVCGSSEELGKWHPSKALVLKWTWGDIWYGVVRLPRDQQLEFKYVLLDVRRNNALKAWADDISSDNLKLHVKEGNQLTLGDFAEAWVPHRRYQGLRHTKTTTTTTTTPAATTTPSAPLHPAERAQAEVQPLVSGVSVKTTHNMPSGATLSSTSPLAPATSTAARLPSATHVAPLPPSFALLYSRWPGPDRIVTWVPSTGASPMAGSPTSGPATTTTGPTLPDVGPFTMGSNRSPTHGDLGAHDATLVAASSGADVFGVPRHEALLAAEAARHMRTQEGGMEMPVSGEAATAATNLSQIAGPGQELPMAPLQSGVTSVDGVQAAAGGNLPNPSSNPLVMAANITIQPAKSLFGKVIGHGSSSPSVAARSTIGYSTNPEERGMPLEVAAAQTNMPAGFSGASQGQTPKQSDWHCQPELGAERYEKPHHREPTPANISEGQEAERRACEKPSKGWLGTHPWG